MSRFALRAAAFFDDEPVQVLHNLNAVLSQKVRSERIGFCTLVYGKLTQSDNGFGVELASGGHPLLKPIQTFLSSTVPFEYSEKSWG
jgi:phosphoserine phosphatase RsbU/P